MAFAFEKLLVYQKRVVFGDAVCAMSRSFPRGFYFPADQLNRAALSIATHIAEGNGRFTVADRRSFFGIARGSVQEGVPLVDIAVRRDVLSSDVHDRLKTDLEHGLPGPVNKADVLWLSPLRYVLMFAGLLVWRKGFRITARGRDLLSRTAS